MALKLVTDNKVGNPDQDGWTFVYDSSQEQIIHTGVYLCALFSFESRTAVDREEINKQILSILYSSFFGNTSKTTFNALKSVIEELINYLHECGVRVSISAVSYDDSAVYVAGSGGGEITIYRNGSFSKLVVSHDVPVVASGYPKVHDVLILSTNTLYSATDVPEVEKAVRTNVNGSGVLGKPSSLFSDFDSAISSAGVFFLTFTQDVEIDKVQMSDDTVLESPHIDQDQIRTKSGSLLSSLSGVSLKGLFSRGRSPERITIEPREITLDETKKRTSLSLGIIIIILLVISIFFGSRKHKDEELKLQYQPQLEQASREYDEALTLIGVSPERARDHFQESVKIVEALISDGVEDPALLALKDNLSDKRGKILGEYSIEAQNYIDLSLKSDGFSGDDMFMSDETVYILDKNTQRAISVEVENKKSEVVAGPGAISSPHYITAYVGRVYVSSDSGLTRVDSGKSVVIEDPLPEQSHPYSFSGNVYIVDTSNSKIYRYTGFDGGVAEKSEWLTEGAEPDLSKIVSFAIDGSIWMVSSSGGVFKFSQGNQVNYDASGVYPALVAPTQIYTNEDLEYLYVLEPSQKRVIVLTKEGGFVAQYISDSFEKTIDFGVSEIEKKLYLLTGSKIEAVDLGHL